MDQPIPESEVFLIPGDIPLPQEVINLNRLAKVSFAPMPKSTVVSNISDIAQEVEQGKKEEVIFDAALSITAVYMRPITFHPIGGNFYRLSYDYNIYPDPNGNFYIFAQLPFQGFDMPAGGEVRFVVTLPPSSILDQNETKGIDLNQNPIEEQVAEAQGKPIVWFYYQNDPEFIVKYSY